MPVLLQALLKLVLIEVLQFANSLKPGNVEFVEEHASGKISYKERKPGLPKMMIAKQYSCSA